MNTQNWSLANVAVSFGEAGPLPHLVAWRDHYFEITWLKEWRREDGGLWFKAVTRSENLLLFFSLKNCLWYIRDPGIIS